MFGIGMPELLIILAVALIVFGPKKLPELAKSLGRAMGEFKRATNDLKDSIQSETSLDSVKNNFKDTGKEIKESVKTAADLDDSPEKAAEQPDSEPPSQVEPMTRVKEAFGALNAEADDTKSIPSEKQPPAEEDPDSQDNNTP